MRTLPIRTWLVLALAAVVGAPALAVTAIFAVHRPTPPDAPVEFIAPAVEQALVAGVARWHDPEWQATLVPELAAAEMGVVLVDEAGRVLFRGIPESSEAPAAMAVSSAPGLVLAHPPGEVVSGTTTVTERPVLPGKELVVAEGERPLGTAYLYALPQIRPFLPIGGDRWDPNVWLPSLAQWASLLIVALLVGWFVNRALLKPLADLSRATRQVAAGKLDVRLSSSRVAEVAEVATAFGAMSEALRLSLERQAELEQERRMVITAVVHDLRTPLFSLRGHLEGLATGLADSPEKAARYLRVARDKADALERLVADLFAYTRTDYLEETPRRDPLVLGEVLTRTVEGLQPQAAAKGVALTLADSGVPCPVAGDAHLLTRAVENLLDNAIRYTPTGGDVRVAWDAQAGGVAFTVADTGPGIPDRDLPHLFAPLYRGETSRNRRTGGTGLGLAIARRLLRAHGGDLTAANAPGGGAVFTATLPDAVPAPAPTPAATASRTRARPLAPA